MKKITLCRKNKINDIIQLKDQLNQQKDKLFQYIDNILENKSREYNKNTYYIHTLHIIIIIIIISLLMIIMRKLELIMKILMKKIHILLSLCKNLLMTT